MILVQCILKKSQRSWKEVFDLRLWHLLIPFLLVLSCSKDKENPQNEKLVVPQESRRDFQSSLIGKDYLIDHQHSYVGFRIKYFGFSPVRGRFNSFDGTAFYDPENLGSLSVTLFIDVNSINTGDATRDEDLKKEGSWFNAAKYPYAKFQSSEIVVFEDGSFDMLGNLTIKGITKQITINFDKPTSITRDWAKNEQVDFSGTTTINRQDFEIFGGDFWSSVMENGLTQLSDEVELEVDIHCRRPDYQARYEDAQATDTDKIVLDIIKESGIDAGLKKINNLYNSEEISSGKLSTIGSTLNEWQMFEDARQIFELKGALFGKSDIVFNQLGITDIFLKDTDRARKNFKKALIVDSTNSRAVEYERLIDIINRQ